MSSVEMSAQNTVHLSPLVMGNGEMAGEGEMTILIASTSQSELSPRVTSVLVPVTTETRQPIRGPDQVQ